MNTPVDYLEGRKILVQLGGTEKGGAEVFAHDCMINMERNISFTAETNDFQVPECGTDKTVSWMTSIPSSMSCEISGGGRLHIKSVEQWYDWLKSGKPKNIRFAIVTDPAAKGGYFKGAFVLTTFSFGAQDASDLASASISMKSSGAVEWVAGS